jgi:heme oxygenase
MTSSNGTALSSALKENTKEAHQALEAVIVKQIKGIRSREEYEQLLHKFYGYHFPLEQQFDQYFDNDTIPHYSERRRADLILKDLANLGNSPAMIPLAGDIPGIDSIAKALGAFYVLEGSTNGGSIVAGMLIKYAGLTPETTSFFYGYGEDKKMWTSFKEKLDNYPGDVDFREQVIGAANETFDRFKDWMTR